MSMTSTATTPTNTLSDTDATADTTNPTPTNASAPNGNTVPRRNGNRPDFVVKKRIGYGDRVSWEQVGVAWQNESGAIFLRFHGTQIISGGVSLFRETRKDGEGA